MLGNKVINELVSQALQKSPQFIGMDNVVAKEILHHEILYFLHKEGFLQQLTFMGGTALRLCYGSNRLSEDLDFAGGQTFSPDKFHGLSEALKNHIYQVYRLNVAVYEPKLEAGDTSTWKLTIEKFANRPDLPSQKCHIDICAYPSLDRVYKPVTDHYGIGSKIEGLPIAVESLEEILADKLIAFAYRERRIKPRDVWDLAWLSQRAIKIDLSLVVKKLELRRKNQNEFIGLINRHAELIKSNAETKRDFYQEMSRFVSPEVSQRTLEQVEFWSYVASVIGGYVDDCRLILGKKNTSSKMTM